MEQFGMSNNRSDFLGVSSVRLLPKDNDDTLRVIVNLTKKGSIIDQDGKYSVNSKLSNLFHVLKFEKVTSKYFSGPLLNNVS